MGDDPYDFEIAIPAAATNAGKSRRTRLSNSNEDVSAVSDSLSNMSDLSNDDESARSSRHQAETSSKGSTKNIKANSTAASSGSALDRAKNFLSKYSTVPAANSNDSKSAKSSRSRLVDLDSDDEDFSLQSSSDEKEATGANSDMKGSEHHDVDASNSDGDESSRTSDHAPPPCIKSSLGASTNPRKWYEEEQSIGNHEDESVESLGSLSDEEFTMPPPAVITASHAARQDDRDDHYYDSFHEESIPSQSSVLDSQSLVTPKFTAVGSVHQSIASESGVYDEDAFEEEESTTARSKLTIAAEPITNLSVEVPRTTEKAEGDFDYSMDFSDDEEAEQAPMHVQTLPSINDKPLHDRSPDQSDEESEEHSSYLGSDHDGNEGNQDLEAQPTDNHQQEAELIATTTYEAPKNEVLSSDISSQRDLVIKNREHPVSAIEEYSTTSLKTSNDGYSSLPENQGKSQATVAARTTPPSTPQGDEAVTTGIPKEKKRPRVTIVRDFELDASQPVEMKDASTQFTGNHAAIQTDLIPDGMHNLLAKSAPVPATPENAKESVHIPPSDTNTSNTPSEQPPPPPVTPLLGSSMYNLDAFRLPITASTSVYKQQLLALQEQILQKKHETERIVQDRMSFQYSTFKGTERFIAARRAQKLELWEALMRVDPALDERKAREVARLAQATST